MSTSRAKPSSIVIRIGSPAMLLTLALVALRVAGVIDWSLWWVFAPLWLPIAALCGFILFAVVGGACALLLAFLIACWADRHS